MARRGAKALAGQSNRALEGVRINRSRRLWTVPGTRWEPGTGRRSGSKPPLRVSRALRWLWRGRKDAGIPWIRRFRRCTGRL